MAHCHIIPDQWSATCGELRLLWSRWQSRDQLIDLDTARAYFRPTACEIDQTTYPPTIQPSKPQRYDDGGIWVSAFLPTPAVIPPKP